MFRHVVWATGFRPFFLSAAVFVAVALPLWVEVITKGLRIRPALTPVTWHAHEMIWGFTGAVIAGFLLTAVRNWTQRPTLDGGLLAGLCGLWGLGRLVMLFGGGLPPWLVGAIDVSFFPILAIAIAVPIYGARTTRNYGFPVMLMVLGALDLVLHLDHVRGWGETRLVLTTAIDLIAVIMVVVGGRVIPLFTSNALPEAGVARSVKWDRIAIAATVAVVGCDLITWPLSSFAQVAGVVAVAAGVVNGMRMVGWQSWATRHKPILWVLHVGYAWIALGLVLRGLGALIPSLVPPSAGTHALTAGAVGTLTLGMMSRVALGHTGRPLSIHPFVGIAYVFVIVGGAVRVVTAFAPATATSPMLRIAGTLFASGFAAYAVIYWGILTKPRADGKPG